MMEYEMFLNCALRDLHHLEVALVDLSSSDYDVDDYIEPVNIVFDAKAVKKFPTLNDYCHSVCTQKVEHFCKMFSISPPVPEMLLRLMHMHAQRGFQLLKSNLDGDVVKSNDNVPNEKLIVVCRFYLDVICGIHRGILRTQRLHLDDIFLVRNWLIALDSKLVSLGICHSQLRREIYNMQLNGLWLALKDAWWLYAIPGWVEDNLPFLKTHKQPLIRRHCATRDFVVILMRLYESMGFISMPNSVRVDMSHPELEPTWSTSTSLQVEFPAPQPAIVFNLSEEESLPSDDEFAAPLEETLHDVTNRSLSLNTETDDLSDETGTSLDSAMDLFSSNFESENFSTTKRLFDACAWYKSLSNALFQTCCMALLNTFCNCAQNYWQTHPISRLLDQLEALERFDHDTFMGHYLISYTIKSLYRRLVLIVVEATLQWLEPLISKAPHIPWPRLEQRDYCGSVYRLSDISGTLTKTSVIVETVARVIFNLQEERELCFLSMEIVMYRCMAISEWLATLDIVEAAAVKRLVEFMERIKLERKVTSSQILGVLKDFWAFHRVSPTLETSYGSIGLCEYLSLASSSENFEKYYYCFKGFCMFMEKRHVMVCLHDHLIIIYSPNSRLQPVAFIDLDSVSSLVSQRLKKKHVNFLIKFKTLKGKQSVTLHSYNFPHCFKWKESLDELYSTNKDHKSFLLHWPNFFTPSQLSNA
ncbi:hypothetical protein BdWA1_002161 [Babesia duncani]|uniref:PH domain-containing protein n=1 Tax=Babesia duncani TaxID=323732 RepID=A0AAD9PL96_9APIC|nr:hypothetical protein BdWA1_002161 [Babesia duncani]